MAKQAGAETSTIHAKTPMRSASARSRSRLNLYELELSRDLWWKSFEVCGVLQMLEEITREESTITEAMRGTIGAAFRLATDVKDSLSRMDDEYLLSPKCDRAARASDRDRESGR